MGDYYHHFLSSMSGAGMNSVTTPDDMQSHLVTGAPMPMTTTTMPGSYQQMGYFPGFSDPIMFNAKSQKNRRKQPTGSGTSADHVKHRRTRSGCFMCRSRRVKCDETRPICERCRKGNRECVYPDPPAAKGAGSNARSKETTPTTRRTSPPSSTGEEDDDTEYESRLETIPDEEEPEDRSRYSAGSIPPTGLSIMTADVQQLGGRETSETPSQEGNKSSSPSTSTATPSSLATVAYPSTEFPLSFGGSPDWSHLPHHIQRCLFYFVDHITHYHYCLPGDADDFFKGILPNLAIRHEPLLNAVVGFSAYHMTLRNPTGKLQDFLQYYNRSVTLLLEFLKRREKHNVATLVTILQLATIEEYLGDWVNLMGHQKAAFEIITKVFSPQTVMQSAMGRMCLNWYARFDNFIALMGGFPTDLPREWFTAMVGFHESQKAAQPDVLRWKMESFSTQMRLITYDMSILFARGCRGQITEDEFNKEHQKLTKDLMDWKSNMDPAILDRNYLVNFPQTQRTNSDDIVDPYTPDILYDFPLFKTTLLCAEWNSIMILHISQSSDLPKNRLYAELRHYAYATCQYFETLEFWPSTPNGVLILIQACIAIAALFLPQDTKHHAWFRRKFALLESMGYIHPLSLRSKMAEMFRDPSCVRWWLPNDEGFSPVLQSIRSFADERNAAAVTAQQENLREVRHIFAKMAISHQGDNEQ